MHMLACFICNNTLHFKYTHLAADDYTHCSFFKMVLTCSKKKFQYIKTNTLCVDREKVINMLHNDKWWENHHNWVGGIGLWPRQHGCGSLKIPQIWKIFLDEIRSLASDCDGCDNRFSKLGLLICSFPQLYLSIYLWTQMKFCKISVAEIIINGSKYFNIENN